MIIIDVLEITLWFIFMNIIGNMTNRKNIDECIV